MSVLNWHRKHSRFFSVPLFTLTFRFEKQFITSDHMTENIWSIFDPAKQVTHTFFIFCSIVFFLETSLHPLTRPVKRYNDTTLLTNHVSLFYCRRSGLLITRVLILSILSGLPSTACHPLKVLRVTKIIVIIVVCKLTHV